MMYGGWRRSRTEANVRLEDQQTRDARGQTSDGDMGAIRGRGEGEQAPKVALRAYFTAVEQASRC